MRQQRTIEVVRLGPLEIALDPPMLYWHGIRREGWRPSQIQLLAALIEMPCATHYDLEDRLGIAAGSVVSVKIAELRNMLLIAGFDLRIASVKDGQRLIGYNLELLE